MSGGFLLGNAFLNITANTSSANNSINSLGNTANKAGESSGKGFGGKFKSALASPLAAGGAMIAGAFAADKIFDFFGDSIDEARESQKVNAQTAAVIKSTGGAAKLTADQFGNLATAISNKTGIDDEQVQSAENMLATFTNVRDEVGKGNDVFSQATSTIIDMSVATGQDAKGAAVMLGKALNDPAAGLSKLTKIGVTFTDAQKNQVKAMVAAGDTMGAQKVILGELNKEFGGSAAAQATSGEKLATMWANFKEQIGTYLLPVLDKFFNFLSTRILPALTNLAAWIQSKAVPAIQSLGRWLGSNLSPIVAQLAGYFRDYLIPAVKEAAQWLADNLQPVISAITGWFQRHAGVVKIATAVIGGLVGAFVLLNAVMAINPVVLIVAALAALVAGIVWAWNHVSWFRTAIETAWNVIKTVSLFLWHNVIDPVFNGIKTIISDAVGFIRSHMDQIKDVWDRIGKAASNLYDKLIKPAFDAISSVVGTVVGWIKAHGEQFKLAFKLMGQSVQWLYNNVVKPVFTFIWNVIVTAVKIIVGAINVVINIIRGVAAVIMWLWRNVIVPAFSAIATTVRIAINIVTGIINNAITVIRTIAAVFQWLWHNIVVPVWNGIQTVISTAVGIVRGAINGVSSAISAVGQAFVNAYNTVKTWIGKIVSAVTGLPGRLLSALGGMLNAGKQLMSNLWQGIQNGLSSAGGFIGDIASKIWNGIKGFINNKLLSPIKNFSISIPLVGKITPFSGIPLLAQGGVIPATPGGRLAVIGEGGADEAVFPLPTLNKMVANVAKEASKGNGGPGTVRNTFYVTIDAKNVDDFNKVVTVFNGLPQAMHAQTAGVR